MDITPVQPHLRARKPRISSRTERSCSRPPHVRLRWPRSWSGWVAVSAVSLCVSPAFATGDELVRRWTFDTSADAEGWLAGNGVTDLGVVDGRLAMTLTDADAYIFAPPIEAPLDGCLVRVRLRGEHFGDTQVYWATRDDPHHNEAKVISRATTPGPDFQTIEFPIGRSADAGRTLTGFRLDPFNGPGEGRVEIAWVELIRRAPWIEATLATERHVVSPGAPITFTVRLEHRAGRADEQTWRVRLPDGGSEDAALRPGAAPKVSSRLRLQGDGVHPLAAVVEDAEGRMRRALAASVIVTDEASPPFIPGIASDRVRLDFVTLAGSDDVGAARWWTRRKTSDPWTPVGWLSPLARLAVQDHDGRMIEHEPAFTVEERMDGTIRLSARIDDASPWRVDLQFETVTAKDHTAMAVQAALHPPDDGALIEFSGPVVLVDGDDRDDLALLDRHALFGGLEFLEPGWPSSSDRAVGELFADRWTPHPFKVALPVMAVESRGTTAAVMWQPEQAWDGTHAVPTATFASPNFISGQPNHLLKLWLPSIPRWVEENTTRAQTPYTTHSDRPLTLRFLLHADQDLPVALTARRWYAFFGAPPAPPMPHDDETTYDLIARNYGETMYWENEQGWRHHWFHTETSSRPIPFMAAELLAHALHTGEKRWVERAGIGDRAIIDAMGPLALQIARDGAARQRLATMRDDGTWPYHDTDHVREQTRTFTGGQYDSLGEDGSTSLGTCVQAALPILRYALLTGDPDCLEGGLRALETMTRFRVPRGAQVWEVHQDIPDIRAAALAVEAYHIGYRLTGEQRWLDEATYWAWAGVPFLYSWRVPMDERPGRVLISDDREIRKFTSEPLDVAYEDPERQVTPYGGIPVFGPTFYVVNWFGVIVQWCALEWAWKVIELDRDRSDPLLRHIADGVVASGFQQMFDRPPWVGLYPDAWQTQSNLAVPAMICAHLPMRCLQAQQRIPDHAHPWTRVLRSSNGDDRLHVSGWGEPVALDAPGGRTWSATVRYLPDQPNELILARVEAPTAVDVDGRPLPTRGPDDAAATRDGWHYDADRSVLLLRFRHQTDLATIRVSF